MFLMPHPPFCFAKKNHCIRSGSYSVIKAVPFFSEVKKTHFLFNIHALGNIISCTPDKNI